MIKKIPKNLTSYYKYFSEADDEDDKITVKVAPRKNRGTDYADDTNRVRVTQNETSNDVTDYSADDESDMNDSDDEGSTDTADASTDDVTDYSADDTGDDVDTTDDNTSDNADTSGPDTGDEETDYSSDDTGAETEDGDAEGDNTGGPDTGDGETDYSSDDTDDASSSDGGEETSSSDDSNSEDDEDKRKKYNMYKRYLNLYEMIDNFLEKLRSMVTSNPVDNSVIKVVMNNLDDLHDNMYDYMTIRFKDETYVQILIFFETIVSVIKLNFELLRNNNVKIKQ